MKTATTLLCLLVLTPAAERRSEAVELRFAPAEGTVLSRSFTARAEDSLRDMTADIGGEVIEPDEIPEDGSRFVETIVVTDTLGAVEDGRPLEVTRTFDELGQESTDAAGETVDLVSDLEGRTVLFTWDEDDEAYLAEAADDGDLDEDRAEWLAEDMDLRLLLPDGEVEPGDEWEVPAELYLAFMWPGGLLDFRPEDEEPDEPEADAYARQTIENLEGEGTATLEEIREEDGVRVAVIRLELDVWTSSERTIPEYDDGESYRPEILIEVELERTLEGTVLWDLDHGHVLSAELECDSERLLTRSWTLVGERDGQELEVDIEESMLYEGTIEYSMTVERR